jgi:putative transposase
MKKVPAPKVVTAPEASESPLPARIQEALGELVGAAREGLLALSVGVGLGVVHELMELEVEEVVGPKGKHNLDRVAVRHGHEDGSMTLGGRRVKVSRPRIRTAEEEHELPIATYEYFADRDPLTRAVMDRMLAGVSTPSKYPRALRSRDRMVLSPKGASSPPTAKKARAKSSSRILGESTSSRAPATSTSEREVVIPKAVK